MQTKGDHHCLRKKVVIMSMYQLYNNKQIAASQTQEGDACVIFSHENQPKLRLSEEAFNIMVKEAEKMNDCMKKKASDYKKEIQHNIFVECKVYKGNFVVDIRRKTHAKYGSSMLYTKEGITLTEGTFAKLRGIFPKIQEDLQAFRHKAAYMATMKKLLLQKLKENDIYFCDGCYEEQPNQLAHECLAVNKEDLITQGKIELAGEYLLADKTFVENFMEVHPDCEDVAQILEECVKDPSLRKGLL